MKGDNMDNYYKVVNDFLTIAKQNPFIKGVEYSNIYEQHNSGNIEYNTFTLTQGENSSQTENEITYNITLYGGLGDFFYDLAYKETGEKLTLADLTSTLSSAPNNPIHSDAESAL